MLFTTCEQVTSNAKISLNRCLHFRENADLTRILRPACQRLKRKVHWLLFGTFDLFHPAKLFTFLPGRHNYHRRYHNPSGKRQLFAPQRFLTFHSYYNGMKYFLKTCPKISKNCSKLTEIVQFSLKLA